MKILVTGGAGFIASNIADEYIRLGHEVFILDNLITGDLSYVNPKARFIQKDICDASVQDLILREKFDLISHHAAQIDVRYAVDHPVLDANTNILGTLNILQAACKAGVKKVIFASSGGGVYGEIPESALPAPETFPINPLSPYGVAKHTVEHYLYLYNKLYNLNYTILRYGNVYGERQGKKGEAGVVSIFARMMLAGSPVTIFGNGEQLRDYVYVKDIVNINMRVSESLAPMKSPDSFIDPCYNIGTGKGYSVNELFRIMESILKTGKKPVYSAERPGEVFKTYIDCTKAKKEMGWTYRYDFEEGVTRTVEWFKNNRDKF